MTEFEDQGVSLTALAVAAGRAVETSRPDALVKDPFAAALVEAAHSHVEFPTAWPPDPEAVPPLQQPLLLASIYIGVRTRFIDDFLQSAPATAQTVVLGAGLDTRSHRLDWPSGSRVFEIDHANVLDFKAGVLARLSPRRRASSSLWPPTCPNRGARCSSHWGSTPASPPPGSSKGCSPTSIPLPRKQC